MAYVYDNQARQGFTVSDPREYLGDPRFTVSAESTGTSTGVGYDPQVGQQQWALTYAEKAAADAAQQATSQYGAETGRMGTVGGLQNTAYGNQTQRALGAGSLYSQLFGQPDNYAATANLLRGQPNASPAHFWGALQGLAPLGQSPNFGAMQTLDANKAVAGFFGAAGANGDGSSDGGSGGGGGDKSDIKWKRDYHQAVRDAGFGTGSAAREAANASIGMGEAAAAHEIKHHRNPYKGGAAFAGGGSLTVPAAPAAPVAPRTFVATDPTRFTIGAQRFVVGERSKDELVNIGPAVGGGTRVLVQPLQNPAVPVPAYAASLANDMVRGSPYRPTALGPLGGRPFIGLPPTAPMGDAQLGYDAYTGPPIPDTRLVLPQLGGLGGAAHGGWTGVYPPEAETPPLSPIGTVPIGRPLPPIGMAMGGAVGVPPPNVGFGGIRALPPIGFASGGQATVYGTPQQPAVLYHSTPTYATSTPNTAGQVTAPAASGGGHVTLPYYEGTGYADPTTADPRTVRRLTPMELSLLDSTSRAQHGLNLSMWSALFRNSLPSWQQASTQSAWTRAS